MLTGSQWGTECGVWENYECCRLRPLFDRRKPHRRSLCTQKWDWGAQNFGELGLRGLTGCCLVQVPDSSFLQLKGKVQSAAIKNVSSLAAQLARRTDPDGQWQLRLSTPYSAQQPDTEDASSGGLAVVLLPVAALG